MRNNNLQDNNGQITNLQDNNLLIIKKSYNQEKNEEDQIKENKEEQIKK